MPLERRSFVAIFVLVVVLALGSGFSFAFSEAVEESEPEGERIDLATDDRSLWLYTSRGPTVDRATLALNVVVYEDPDRVERHLREVGNWEELDEDELDAAPDEVDRTDPEGAVDWERTTGDQRYVALLSDDGFEWMTQSFELGDGEYLGYRVHVRVYEPPDGQGNWTVMQAHDEYWDFFDARHVVPSVEAGQSAVEDEFVGHDYEVVRERTGGRDRVDFDGWVTVITPDDSEAAGLLVFGGLALVGAVRVGRERVRERFDPAVYDQEVRAVGLAAVLVATYMFVRLAAVFLEQTVDVAPNTIATVLHPILIAGLPLAAFILAGRLDRDWAFAGAALGFVLAIFVDYSYLGVSNVPLDILVHRGAMALALGLIAVGGSRTERQNPERRSFLQVGALLWVAAVLLPLLKHTPLPV